MRCSAHMQGIKFYDPEIVGDTPETVELVGVRNLLAATKERVGRSAGQTIFAPDGSVTAATQPLRWCLRGLICNGRRLARRSSMQEAS